MEAVTAIFQPAPHRAIDFPEIRRAMLAGEAHYWPYAMSCSRPVPAEAHGMVKCDYCGTVVAVTIRGACPGITADCPGCGAPLEPDP